MFRLFHFETRREPMASRRILFSRLTRNAVWAFATIAISLLIGCWGYMSLEGMSLIDAFANAAMILSGMGPLNALHTNAGKIFASLYAIACGLLLFAIAGLMLAPVFHRILHRFHLPDEGGGDGA